MEELYRETIIELYKNPMNKKVLDDVDVEQRGHNPSCGDDITLQLKRNNDILENIGFQGDGCAISIAALSLLTEEMKGKSLDQIRTFSKDDMLQLLEIPISHTRMKCALLGWQTLQQALDR